MDAASGAMGYVVGTSPLDAHLCPRVSRQPDGLATLPGRRVLWRMEYGFPDVPRGESDRCKASPLEHRKVAAANLVILDVYFLPGGMTECVSVRHQDVLGHPIDATDETERIVLQRLKRRAPQPDDLPGLERGDALALQIRFGPSQIPALKLERGHRAAIRNGNTRPQSRVPGYLLQGLDRSQNSRRIIEEPCFDHVEDQRRHANLQELCRLRAVRVGRSELEALTTENSP